MAMKHGFDSVEAYKEGVQKKFSLLETGIIHKPSTRLLLINVSFNLNLLSLLSLAPAIAFIPLLPSVFA